MTTARSEVVGVWSEADVVNVRHLTRKWSAELRFGLVDQTKLTTAASELARNTLVHGKGGTARIEEIHEPSRIGLRLTFEDKGPGIADVALALTDGYTTGGGLGLGLGGSRRLMHEMTIESSPGAGTRVVVTHFKKP